jgi:G:T-mismatch repair DNA endonuclease (very short patch repair protein)
MIRPAATAARRALIHSYWLPKLARNRERDAANVAALQASGWDVLVIWECETGNIEALKARLIGFLGPRVDASKQSNFARAEK